MKIYSAPKVDRREIAKKMLFHCITAFAVLAIPVTALFVNISKDSAKNRDAVIKISSEATEFWAVVTFVVFLAAIAYITVAGIILSRKVRKQFSNWVWYKNQLYCITASVPYVSAKAQPQQVTRVQKIQDQALAILNDSYTLTKILENEIIFQNIRAIQLERVEKITEKKYGAEVCFHHIKTKISNQTEDFEELMQRMKEYVIS